MTPGDRIKVTSGEFERCAGYVERLEDGRALVKLTHSNGVPLNWHRYERIDLRDLEAE